MCSHQHSPLSHHIHNKVHLLLRGFEPKSNLVQYSFLRRFLSKLFISRDGRALFFYFHANAICAFQKGPAGFRAILGPLTIAIVPYLRYRWFYWPTFTPWSSLFWQIKSSVLSWPVPNFLWSRQSFSLCGPLLHHWIAVKQSLYMSIWTDTARKLALPFDLHDTSVKSMIARIKAQLPIGSSGLN